MIISSLSHYVFGYRYNPIVAGEFQNDLSLILDNVEPHSTILVPEDSGTFDFYKILQKRGQYIISSNTPSTQDKENITKIATLGKWPAKLPYNLSRIITSQKTSNSDRIYLYEDKTELGE